MSFSLQSLQLRRGAICSYSPFRETVGRDWLNQTLESRHLADKSVMDVTIVRKPAIRVTSVVYTFFLVISVAVN
jgi:hypothetical protein